MPKRTPATWALVLLAALSSAVAEGEPDVRFVTPRHRATVIGVSPIEVRPVVPDGATVRHVEIRVDGHVVGRLAGAPWVVEWNAGEGDEDHRLEAILVLEDGRQARSTIDTRALRIDFVEQVDLVNLYLLVRDTTGNHVTDLGPDDFKILENGVEQRIERFTTSHKPLRLAIVLDTSLTMSRDDKLEKAKAAATQFLDLLRPGDEALVACFSDDVRIVQDFSSDKRELAAAIAAAEATGGTALYDAVWRTSRSMQGFDGRRVLVLLSDGRDEARNGLEPGSLHTFDEAVEQALRNEVMIFTIGLGRNLDREYAMRWGHLGGRSNVDTERSLEALLREMAESTGGRAVITTRAGKLRRAFGEFASDLRHQYSIAYTSSDPARDGKWRKVDVQVPDRRFEVVTRKGYYAN